MMNGRLRIIFAYMSFLVLLAFSANGLLINITAESGDWHTTIKSASQVLAMNYMHLGTHLHIIKAYLETGEKEKAIPHQHFLRSCLRSVHRSGDGQSYRTAYIAISLDEDTVGTIADYNLCVPASSHQGSHGLSAEPGFIAPRTFCYWLREDSIARGKGAADFAPKTDFWGRKR